MPEATENGTRARSVYGREGSRERKKNEADRQRNDLVMSFTSDQRDSRRSPP